MCCSPLFKVIFSLPYAIIKLSFIIFLIIKGRIGGATGSYYLSGHLRVFQSATRSFFCDRLSSEGLLFSGMEVRLSHPLKHSPYSPVPAFKVLLITHRINVSQLELICKGFFCYNTNFIQLSNLISIKSLHKLPPIPPFVSKFMLQLVNLFFKFPAAIFTLWATTQSIDIFTPFGFILLWIEFAHCFYSVFSLYTEH